MQVLAVKASQRTTGAPAVAPTATMAMAAVMAACALAVTPALVVVLDETATVTVMEVV